MKSPIYCFLIIMPLSTGTLAGGLLGDIMNSIAPGVGTELDSAHKSFKEPVPVYKHLEEGGVDNLQSFDSIKQNNAPTMTTDQSAYYNTPKRNVRYSYVCITPYGSCPINSYGVRGSACFCSTPYGFFYGIAQ